MQPERIRLLKFITCFEIGGTERQVATLARGLDAGKFELSMACLYKTGAFLEDIEPLQIPVDEYSIGSLRSPRAFAEAIRFAQDIRRKQIQIVHTYNFYSNTFAIPSARIGGAPVVIASIRDTQDELAPMRRQTQKFVCRWADCIVVNAEAIRRRLVADGYDGAKIRVIENGIDLSRFARKNGSGKLRQEFGLSPTAPVVVVLSRLSSVKGIDDFLEAAAIVARDFEEARFLIVGDYQDEPAYKTKLERHALRLGLGQRAIFAGFRLDVPEVLSEAAVSVLPCTSNEGLSNTLLESMAVGLPVVATRVGGNPEVVKDGVTGLLVPPGDPAALARAIGLLLQNRELASNFGRAGRDRVVEHFSVERMTRDTEELYLELLQRKRKRQTTALRYAKASDFWT